MFLGMKALYLCVHVILRRRITLTLHYHERKDVSANIRVHILTANVSKIQVEFGVLLLNLFTKVENVILITCTSKKIITVPGRYDYIF